MRIDSERHEELAEKYKNRNVLEELAYFSQFPPSGYTRKADSEFIAWMCKKAYDTIKKGEVAAEHG